MAKVGDRVRFLNATGGGVIRRIEGNIAYVDDDGFETPTLIRELVVIASAPLEEDKPKVSTEMPKITPAAAKTPELPKTSQPVEEPLPIEETPEGDRLNVVLAYEPSDLQRLSQATYDTYLVNDSNYYLYFTYLSRSNDERTWTTRYAGVVEPNIQLFLEEIEAANLPEMDRIAVQILAFKSDKAFQIKQPVAVEMPLDTTKFFKLHCFKENIYFDKDVIAVELVTNDVPYRQKRVDPMKLEEALRQKKSIDRPVRKPIKKRVSKNPDVIEVDLHINELLDSTKGLSPADILNYQIDEFRKVMDANIKNKGQKIVFIHGKGEGVLRAALMKELNHRYKGHQVQDASFREYGFGATQVII